MINKTITDAIENVTGLDLMRPEMNEVVEVKSIVSKQSDLSDIVHDFKIQAKENLKTDYNFARDNLRTLLSRGMVAVEGAIQLACESESPRVYEAISTFIKTLAEINKDLLSLSETVAKSHPGLTDSSTQNTGTVSNNVIYVGSSEDLASTIQKTIKKF